jgi:O-antigen ligase
MTPQIALFGCISFIVFLLILDYRRNTSGFAAWIPLLWFVIVLSRPLSLWINPGPGSSELPYDMLEGNPVNSIYYSTLIFAGAVTLYTRRIRWGELSARNIPVVFFLFYCTISISWSEFPATAARRWVKVLGDLIMILILLTEGNPAEAIKSMIKRLSFILLPLSVLFIKYFPEYGRVYHRWTGDTMYTGVATQKNSLGLLCMILGFFLFHYLLQALRDRSNPWRRQRDIFSITLMLVLMVWLLVLAKSATALLTLLFGIFFLAIMQLPVTRGRPGYVGLFGVLGLVFAAAVILVADVFPAVFAMLGRDATLTGRTQFWWDLINVSINPLIGTGFESFWLGDRVEKLWFNYYWRPNQAHNGFLEVYLNFGVIGLALLGSMLVSFFTKSKAELRNHYDRGALRVVFFIMVILYNMTEASFRAMTPIWLFLLLLNVEYPAGDARQPDSILRDC